MFFLNEKKRNIFKCYTRSNDVNKNYYSIATLRCGVRVTVAVVIRSTSRTKARQSSQATFDQRHLPDVLATSALFDSIASFADKQLWFWIYLFIFSKGTCIPSMECIVFCASFFNRTNELKMLKMQYVRRNRCDGNIRNNTKRSLNCYLNSRFDEK